MLRGQRQSVQRISDSLVSEQTPYGYAFVVMVRASWRSNKTAIKFMISCFKGKIYAHKAAGIILNSKSDHFISAFGLIFRFNQKR
ncbi:hypothetical protein CXF72_06470 [Psychromonas sp. MB-3u-54]|nr:hypothetical protein CXF72_06470 [Psychromonas sp. MB-3u-54]